MSFTSDAGAIFDGPLGVDATYTPDGGSAAPVRVIPDLADSSDRFGEANFRSVSARFWLLVADVAAPVAGDTLTVDGATYTVQGAPVRDERRLKWRIEARPE